MQYRISAPSVSSQSVTRKKSLLLTYMAPTPENSNGLRVYHADITHEASYTPGSLAQAFFCHGLRTVEFRDPWPAPVSPARAGYRLVVRAARALEGAKMRLLGLEPPTIWSPVLWALAEKGDPPGAP